MVSPSNHGLEVGHVPPNCEKRGLEPPAKGWAHAVFTGKAGARSTEEKVCGNPCQGAIALRVKQRWPVGLLPEGPALFLADWPRRRLFPKLLLAFLGDS